MARFFSYGRKGLFTCPRFIAVSLFSEQLSVRKGRRQKAKGNQILAPIS
jgi:hypothetical protein